MSGLGAFIRGAFEGKNIRDGWDDRKRRQKSEDVQAERATEAFD